MKLVNKRRAGQINKTLKLEEYENLAGMLFPDTTVFMQQDEGEKFTRTRLAKQMQYFWIKQEAFPQR